MEFRPVEAIENMFKDTAESLCNAATGPARMMYGVADGDPRAVAGAALDTVGGALSTLDTVNGGIGGIGRRALGAVQGEAAEAALGKAGIKLPSAGHKKEWPCISGEYNSVAERHGPQRIPEWAQPKPERAPRPSGLHRN